MGALASGAGGGRLATLARWRPYVVVVAPAGVIGLVPARQIGKSAERGSAPAAASTGTAVSADAAAVPQGSSQAPSAAPASPGPATATGAATARRSGTAAQSS